MLTRAWAVPYLFFTFIGMHVYYVYYTTVIADKLVLLIIDMLLLLADFVTACYKSKLHKEWSSNHN